MPLLIGLIPFIIGIVINEYLDIPDGIFLIVVTGLLTLLILGSKNFLHYDYRSLIIPIAFIAGGGLHASYQQKETQRDHIPTAISKGYHRYTAELTSISSTKLYTNLSTSVKGIVSPFGKYHPLTPVQVIIKIKDPTCCTNLLPGSQLEFQSNLRPITIEPKETGFDYNAFLKRKGIEYIGYSQDIPDVLDQTDYSFYKVIRYDIRSKALHIIDQSITDQNANAITKALLLGYKNDLDEELRTAFVDSGTMHILAVSGLHVGIVAYLLFLLLGKVFYWLPKYSLIKVAFIILGLAFFAELSGGAPPVWRAVLMSSVYLVARSTGYYIPTLNLIALAAWILILINYQYIFNLSFQLSFTAVIGIVLIYPIFEKLYFPTGKIGRYILGIVYMGIAAQIALAPLSFYYFNQISLLSPITSVVAIASAFIIILSGMLLLTAGWISEILSSTLASIIESVIYILEQSATIMANIKIGILSNVYVDNYEVLLLCLAFICIVISIYKKSFRIAKIGLTCLMLQGFYHTSLRIAHTNCIDIVYNDTRNEIEEIYIGHTAYLNQEDQLKSYKNQYPRRRHLISKYVIIPKILGDRNNYKVTENKSNK